MPTEAKIGRQGRTIYDLLYYGALCFIPLPAISSRLRYFFSQMKDYPINSKIRFSLAECLRARLCKIRFYPSCLVKCLYDLNHFNKGLLQRHFALELGFESQ